LLYCCFSEIFAMIAHLRTLLSGRIASIGAACLLAIIALATCVARAPRSEAQTASRPALKVALAISLTGYGEFYGEPALEGGRLAAEDANAEPGAQPIALDVLDDHSTDDGAIAVARQADAEDALVVVGPDLTAASLAAGFTYAEAGLASIVPTAHGDGVTDNETTFRSVFSTSEMGDAFANYLFYVLGRKRAVVIFRDNGFGRPIASGFKAAAERLGIVTDYRSFSAPAERDAVAKLAASDPDEPAIILGIVNDDALPLISALRRQGVRAPMLGPSALAGESFARLFGDQPEEQRAPGFFTNGLYTASPIMPDSAGAETLAFSERFHARYGHEPTWVAMQVYDATRLAIRAVRAAADANPGTHDPNVLRKSVIAALTALDGPATAVQSLTGPLWFTPDRGRRLAIRVGRFHDGLFESAPVQLVPVTNPDPAEIAAGTLVDIGNGRFARRQEVVYTGLYLNEIARVDIAQSTFTADFYLWVRFVRGTTPGAADPTDLDFPDLVRGSFDGKRPAAQRDLDDGTTYRLWRMRGDFKNDFDLRRYPADVQRLAIRFFNARAASDRIVYVLDQRTFNASPAAAPSVDPPRTGAIAAAAATSRRDDAPDAAVAPTAFRNLTQWTPAETRQRRDTLVTQSALGDPQLVGLERVRELSGFNLSVDLSRRVIATLMKTLLPLGLMALIMYASLHFPAALVKEKVTVAITGALSGAVLLSSINAQLGNVGYVIAVEYGFYVFFSLCLLCIVAVLIAERCRATGRQAAALFVERSGRVLFLLGCAGTAVVAWSAFARA